MIELIGEPTIKDLVRAHLVNDFDRAALCVRHPLPKTDKGFLVVLGKGVPAEFGMGLKDFAKQLGSVNSNEALSVDPERTCRQVFTWLALKGQKWSWGSLSLTTGDVFVLCAYMFDEQTARAFTRFLENRKCPVFVIGL